MILLTDVPGGQKKVNHYRSRNVVAALTLANLTHTLRNKFAKQ